MSRSIFRWTFAIILGVINQWLENGAVEEPQTISALISSLGYR
ncbi:hypothetical protein [Saccharibacillus sacchari]|uniref:Uncharacterized protein n=1 Tax=Saccharibacillus sacchari TaxID=456493 RepID=A0ACC6PEN1_9BACL